MNDWVDEVRVAALKAIEPYLLVEYAQELIKNLYLISRLEYSRARGFGNIKERTLSVLLNSSAEASLYEALGHSDITIKRTCYKLYLQLSNINNSYKVLQNGVTNNDELVRLFCAKKLVELPKDSSNLELLKKLKKDHFLSVRKEVIDALSKFDYKISKDLIYEFLVDKSTTIRQSCRKLIIQIESEVPNDYFCNYYVNFLKSNTSKDITGAIGGLGETGDKNHSEIITKFLNHSNAKVRKASIKALFKLNPDDFIETFYHHLINDVGSVAKEAAIAISRSNSLILSERLLKIFDQVESTISKLVVVWLINESLSKYDKLIALLRVCKTKDEVVFEKCKYYLDLWLYNFNIGPTSATTWKLEIARDALRDVEERLDPDFCKRASFYLKDI